MYQSRCSIPIYDYDELDSTNAEAKRMVDRGSNDAFVVSAIKQTAGRGRFGRAWHAPENNVAMTIALPRTAEYQDLTTLPLMTGLAIHDVLQGLVNDRAAVKIKWPNDIAVDDAKISGTLIESELSRFYVGIGVNLVAEPDQVIFPTTSLGRFYNMERLALVERIASSWLARFERWTQAGFAPIAEAYTRNIWRHGQSISIALKEARTKRVDGLCLGVNKAGLLLLELPEGEVRAFSTGDVGA
jgi:BirA family transcriptional regulator, biotin operon repressor / biotin---[acetyl-CoA-carboxylase] ligase